MVKKITEVSRLRKKQTKIIKLLLLIFVPLILFLSFVIWKENKSIDVGYSQIESATLSDDKMVSVTIKGNRFYNYKGYMSDFDDQIGEVQIELIQGLGLFSGKKQNIEIPIDFDINLSKIKNVVIVNDDGEKVFKVKKEEH
ncbi:hypothetical protein BCR22_05685 [Enterococcus plantarum]|uniref:hypothetical protein n=1 Tax=Enterococcus plantarum TaxID=1077675 RepID=UPI00084DBE3E|nr:hypothetical protein [Enterococcus plantarum]OEG11212.1 hypothetical protein BCR22_05685 [Enterococcus plantarum]